MRVSLDWHRVQYKALRRKLENLRREASADHRLPLDLEEQSSDARPSPVAFLPLALVPWGLFVAGKEEKKVPLGLFVAGKEGPGQQTSSGVGSTGLVGVVCRLWRGTERVVASACEDAVTMMMAGIVGVICLWFTSRWLDTFWYLTNRRVQGLSPLAHVTYRKAKLRAEDKRWRALLVAALTLAVALLWQNSH